MQTNVAVATVPTSLKKLATPKMEIAKPTETAKPTDSKPEQKTKVLTIADIKERANLLMILGEKHTNLSEKLKSLEKFALTHDKNNSQIHVVDATGSTFESSNPKSISRLIEFWKEEFKEAITDVEKQLTEVASN